MHRKNVALLMSVAKRHNVEIVFKGGWVLGPFKLGSHGLPMAWDADADAYVEQSHAQCLGMMNEWKAAGRNGRLVGPQDNPDLYNFSPGKKDVPVSWPGLVDSVPSPNILAHFSRYTRRERLETVKLELDGCTVLTMETGAADYIAQYGIGFPQHEFGQKPYESKRTSYTEVAGFHACISTAMRQAGSQSTMSVDDEVVWGSIYGSRDLCQPT